MSIAARRLLLPASIGAMSAIAWLAMWRLGQSPWGHWLHAHQHPPGGHGSVADAASLVSLGAAFVTGWIVMTVAMMLPTTLPFVAMFGRLTAERRDHVLLVMLVIGGYLAVWAVCGLVVFGASLLVHAHAAASEWMTASPQVPTAALCFVAGAFQFSQLKYRCLDRCRSPLSFITSRWRGGYERWRSFRLGLEHGAFCVGCCWALMLLMFAAGAASLLWMLALGGVMAVEKNVPWGRRLSAPLGGLLLMAAVALMLFPNAM